ncbi:hypothetical protein KCU65_g6884, partial [Aureobasidium melanogenum]
MPTPLDQWFEHCETQNHGTLPQHTQILKTLVEDQISPHAAAKKLIDNTSSNQNPADVAYRLWNLLFHIHYLFGNTTGSKR